MDVHLKRLLRARVLSGSVILLVAAGGKGRSGDGGAAPLVAGDYVFSVPSFAVVCTDGSRFVVDGASEVIRITESANAIAVTSITFADEALAEFLDVEILDARQSGRAQEDSTFSIEASATLRDRFDGDLCDVAVNVEGRFKDDGWSGQVRYSLGSRKLRVTFNGQAPFFGARIATGANLGPEPSRTGAVPFAVYDAPGVVFRVSEMQ